MWVCEWGSEAEIVNVGPVQSPRDLGRKGFAPAVIIPAVPGNGCQNVRAPEFTSGDNVTLA